MAIQFTETDRQALLARCHWSPTEDLCLDVYQPTSRYELPKGLKLKHGPMPAYWVDQLHLYIAACTRDFPFQLRHYLGLPMWERAMDVWADTGDLKKSFRAV